MGQALGHCLFDTALGTCGIAWTAQALAAVQLPEADAEGTRRRLLQATGGLPQAAPPPFVALAMARIGALLAGSADDLCDLPLDLETLPAFRRRVYEITRAIPPGQVLTYGEVARRLGRPGAARAVGQALGRNPFAPVVPCHRVLAAGGRPGGFSAQGGTQTKLRMLQMERARLAAGPGLFD